MKKSTVFACLFFICSSPFIAGAESSSASQKNISAQAQNLINSFFTLRMNLSLYDRNSQTKLIISDIDAFTDNNKQAIQSCNEQEQLIISNFAAMEKYNYLYQIPAEKEGQRLSMQKQKDLCESYYKTHSEEDSSKWLLCTCADVTSCYMGFSFQDVVKYGMKIKPLYQKALAQDEKFAYGLMNMAQWYYYAPAISGGGKKKALEYFEKAAAAAATPAEKYFAEIFLSQSLFEFKQYDRSSSVLEHAATFCPQSTYIALIRKANKNGMSLFEYNKSMSSLNEESKH
jgi:hypothetical protein